MRQLAEEVAPRKHFVEARLGRRVHRSRGPVNSREDRMDRVVAISSGNRGMVGREARKVRTALYLLVGRQIDSLAREALKMTIPGVGISRGEGVLASDRGALRDRRRNVDGFDGGSRLGNHLDKNNGCVAHDEIGHTATFFYTEVRWDCGCGSRIIAACG